MNALCVIALIFLMFISLIDPAPNSSMISDTLQVVSAIKHEVYDKDLKVETVYAGLEYPTSMAFIGSDDILVTEKDKGTVQRIVNGQKQALPSFDTAVANENERGLLGIAFVNQKLSPQIYLYFTESNNKTDGNDYCPKITSCVEGNDPLGIRIYRYDLGSNAELKNPMLILNLPATPGSDHVGGGLLLGPDHNIYLTVGDGSVSTSISSNVKNGTLPDGRGGILKIPVNDSNKPLANTTGIFGSNYPSNLYYAYGIRNGFGLDFDPVTGMLWDTENGRDFGDEINLVEPGFNSGWNMVQGLWETQRNSKTILSHPEDSLFDINGKGRYSSPEFTWNNPVGLTALKFFDSDKLGAKYKNDLFVADIHNGNIYHFDLNKKRTGLVLEGKLADKIADYDEDSSIVFASGFHGITDMEIGPDGYLYILSFHNDTRADRHHYYGTGGIYRISPSD